MEPIVKKRGKQLFLKDGFGDFNQISLMNGKRRMPFKKFYVYQHDEIVVYPNRVDHHIKILEKHPNPLLKNTFVVLYLDPIGRLSFMIMKRHRSLPDEKVLEKAESTPPHRVFTCGLLANLFIIGAIRFRYANMSEVNIAIGYDKALDYDFKYFLPRFIRKKLAENTNKLVLLSQLGFCRIKLSEVLRKYQDSSEINNPMYIKSLTLDGLSYYYPLKFNGYDRYDKNHYIYSSRRYTLERHQIQSFLRKSITGQLVLVISDYLNKAIPIKEKVAKWLSVFGQKRSRDIYFEKFASGASESAFEVFQYAKSQHDNKAVFVLDKSHEQFQTLQSHYGKDSVVAHNSVKAFYAIFHADKLISSDLPTHILRNLYDNSRQLKKVILQSDKKIFLQHGISLATNVFERGYYNRKVPIAPDYIVTNSDLESSYFIQYPKYEPSQLIQKGTPNLDLYVQERKQEKQEISFLLTWRPWDVTGKIEENSYIDRYLQFFQMIQTHDFYQEIPVNLILHPKAKLLIENQFADVYASIEKFIYEGDIKDALLRSKVVITDYSSICYYAFAGGSNIIYFWGDKALAEQEYGAPNILQEENCFGDVVYHVDEQLHHAILTNYHREQPDQYVQNYAELVEYTDGDNTKNVYRAIQAI
ncbi:CDP-glycerol glycerophosphotransferase family protein [Gracilibacillus timonensis]|nr:CDP-glycerol glycerophosphotransferase family protein [Gracilibacillus timonensis]